jgi:hypothetical protein
MRNRYLLSLSIGLLLLPTAASAQLRFQPPQPFSRLDTRPLRLRESPYRVAIADTLRRQSYWQTGFWMGAATGAALGVLFAATYGYEGKVTTGKRIEDGLITTAIVGGPLAVIGAFIGDAFKKPVSSGAGVP